MSVPVQTARPGRRERLVVIGNGMAGSRLAEEVLARDTAGRWHVTVVGDEPVEAYNRIQLSAVLAGHHDVADLTLAPVGALAEAGADVLTGLLVSRVHRSTRTVHLSDGSTLAYDRLVLATGSAPVLPPIPGLLRVDPERPEGLPGLHPQAFAFRTLADCEGLLDAASTARRAVVVGGGLLGLEAARGLTERGVAVEVVQMAGWLMNGQLDPDAGEVLRRTLARRGITTYLGTRATQLVSDRRTGRLRGVRLADGHVLDCDLIVFAAGVRANQRLAREARLATARGVLVDETLTSPDDPRVHAVGDCAEVVRPDGTHVVSGLVAPAWEQADTLARTLTAPDGSAVPARWRAGRVVTRLKASGVDLAAMGEVQAAPADSDGDTEVLVFSDWARGVYTKIVLRGGRVAGGILLGDTSSVGALTTAFDRGSPVPPDRRFLLFTPRYASAAAAPVAELADDATVCHCNQVPAGRIRDAVRCGAHDVAAVAACTRASTGCGSCAGDVRALIASLLDDVEAAPDTERSPA
ncbi:FAD-dependent oxidoreductase [Aquipuribacter sp. SD81]|uniref:FAD-dependent oxidoreductase n=1 Tax=Aquipuribacter sp. SD81 TaxID=3127703 RepID=UPI0030176D1C